MYTYMHSHMYIYIHIYIHIHAHIYIHTHIAAMRVKGLSRNANRRNTYGRRETESFYYDG